MRIKELCHKAYEIAKDKGWHNEDEVTLGEMLTNVHSEVSEAWECWRCDELGTVLREDGKPEGFPSELADIMIRVADIAETLNIDLEDEINCKLTYNRTRPYRHGGKRA